MEILREKVFKAMNHRFKFMEFMVTFIYLYTPSPLLIKQQQHALGPPATLPPSLISLHLIKKKKTKQTEFNVYPQNKILTKINSNVL